MPAKTKKTKKKPAAKARAKQKTTAPRAPKTRPMTRAELARRAGRSRSAVTRACAPGGALEPAIIQGTRGKIDAGHPAVEQWIGDAGAALPELPKSLGDLTLEEAEHLLDVPYRELRSAYGISVSEWIGIKKALAEVQSRQARTAAFRGELVSRKTVDIAILGRMEALRTRLVFEAPRTIANDVRIACARGASIEEVGEIVRDAIQDHITMATLEVDRAMRKKAA